MPQGNNMINEKLNVSIKPARRVNRFSVFANSRWSFSDTSFYQFYKVDDAHQIARIPTRFAVLYEDETDPSSGYAFGEINDYLTIDFEGNLAIMTKEKYNKIYRS